MRNEGREPDRNLPHARGSQSDRDKSANTGQGSEFVGSEYIGSSNQDTGGMEGGQGGKGDKQIGAVSEKIPKKSKRPAAKSKT